MNKKVDLSNFLKKERLSKKELAKRLKCGVSTIEKLMKELRNEGVGITSISSPSEEEREYFIMTHPAEDTKIYKHRTNPNMVRIGIISDTHLCSNEERLDLLYDFYSFLKKEGIRDVYHAGDITDGMYVYAGQENSIHVWGGDKQAKYVIDNYPKFDGITTYFITGNHDLKTMLKSGVDVGNLITNGVSIDDNVYEGRKDLVYLGQYHKRVLFNEGVTLDLIHPDKGVSYAVSYSPQRYADGISGGDKPNILAYGHLHQSLYLLHRNIHILMPGCFQDQNDYLKRKALQPQKGGWLVEFKIKDGGVDMIKPIWKSYYV